MRDRNKGERLLAYLVGGAFVIAGLVRNSRSGSGLPPGETIWRKSGSR